MVVTICGISLTGQKIAGAIEDEMRACFNDLSIQRISVSTNVYNVKQSKYERHTCRAGS